MSKVIRYLLDVNVLVAVLDEDHVHHKIAQEWFHTPGRQWAVCSFTEAGLLRYMTRPDVGDLSMAQATAMVIALAQAPGYYYQPISTDWQTLCGRFFKRLFGHKQITDAYLLGLAVHAGLVLATFDMGIIHMAGEYSANYVHLLR